MHMESNNMLILSHLFCRHSTHINMHAQTYKFKLIHAHTYTHTYTNLHSDNLSRPHWDAHTLLLTTTKDPTCPLAPHTCTNIHIPSGSLA